MGKGGWWEGQLCHTVLPLAHGGSNKLFWSQRASPIPLPCRLPPLVPCPWPRTQCASVGCHGETTQTCTDTLALLCSITAHLSIEPGQCDQCGSSGLCCPCFATASPLPGTVISHCRSPARALGQQETLENLSKACCVPGMGHMACSTAQGFQTFDGDNSGYSDVVLRLGDLGHVLPTHSFRMERILDLALGG